MQQVSALYRELHADPGHVKEVKATIGGTEYGQSEITGVSVSGSIFTTFSVGSCIARELDLTLFPKSTVPRMAEIKLFVRLVLGTRTSEWLPVGVFYIDTRTTDEQTGLLTLHCYDAMLKAEAVWITAEEDAGEWPITMTAAVSSIAGRMGVAVDSRTVINPAYRVDYPNDYTMREVLGYIAAAHGGNWLITPEGKLRLVTLGELPAETNLLVDDADGGAILFGEVRILV